MLQNSSSQKKKEKSLLLLIGIFVKNCCVEFWKGVSTNTLPWPLCCGVGTLFAVFFTLRWDAFAWRYYHLARFYPFHPFLYWTYVAIFTTSGFWLWSIRRAAARRQLVERLSQVFRNAGLQTRTGKLPGFIADEKIDTSLRKLVLSAGGLPEAEFKKAKPFLETELQVFIDQIKSQVDRGTVTLFYAHDPLPEEIPFDPTWRFKPLTFRLGITRTQPLDICLIEVPHLLIAGYTNSGKSAVLRQALTTLTICSPGVEFTLIDLKRGLELGIFDGIPNVRLYITPTEAIEALKYVETQLEKRMALLRANRCNDLITWNQLPVEKRVFTSDWPPSKPLARQVVVIDEAAELFLASATVASKDAQVARRLAAKIAALGRAVGIHLIIATQRPDRNAVDPLIKSNLQGRLCFQMADNASSMTILDSVRAADLPPTKGRAIWRSGFDLIEVQVPWLPRDAMEPILAPYKKKTAQESISSPSQVTPSESPAAVSTEDGIAHHDEDQKTGGTENPATSTLKTPGEPR